MGDVVGHDKYRSIFHEAAGLVVAGPNYSFKGNADVSGLVIDIRRRVPLTPALGPTSTTQHSEKCVRHWSVSLTMRGFDCTPEQAQDLVGFPAESLGTRGLPTKPGRTPLKRSFVRYSVKFSDPPRIDQMVPAILARTGGVDHLCVVRDAIKPEFFEIDLSLPVKNSLEQEGGFISLESIADLNRLRSTISFGILVMTQ